MPISLMILMITIFDIYSLHTNVKSILQICSKLPSKTPDEIQIHPGIFIFNNELCSHLTLLFLLMMLNITGTSHMRDI